MSCALTRTRVLVALHRAFEHVANAKLLADLLGVEVLPLKVKAVLRAMTKLSRMRDKSVVRFSVMPSAK